MTRPTVETTSGPVVGEDLPGGGAAFRGIPFAAPPLAARRFAPPEPAEPWSEPRDAVRFGNASVQVTAGGGLGMFGPGELPTDEDCLTLNVWSPGLDDTRRPVMVWIHGGAFRLGTAGAPMYDGRRLAERGDVVVVSANYRLGLLGFLASPELGAANLGLLDQVAALRWVQREIERFGGDPDRVTVFGESAGAKSVECLLAMPAARGLFHRAILQSTYATSLDLEPVAARTREIAARMDIPADDLERLRTADLDALLGAEAEVLAAAGPAAVGSGGGGPVVDGEHLPIAPIDAVAEGVAREIPLLLGTTLDEARLFAAMGSLATGGPSLDEPGLLDHLARLLGTDPASERARGALVAYREARLDRGQTAEPPDIAVDAMTDRMFRQHSLRLAEAAARHGETYMYLFTWPSPVAGGVLGACHGIEIPFVFGTLGLEGGFGVDGEEAAALSDAVQDAWLSFAKGGPPTSEGLDEWPAYATDGRATMVLGTECRVEEAPMEAIRRAWEGTRL